VSRLPINGAVTPLTDPTASREDRQRAMRAFNGNVVLRHQVIVPLTETQKIVVARHVDAMARVWFDDKDLRESNKFSRWLTGRKAYDLSASLLIAVVADELTATVFSNIFFSFRLKKIDNGLYVCHVVVNKEVLPNVD
jgi:hypothetical protein